MPRLPLVLILLTLVAPAVVAAAAGASGARRWRAPLAGAEILGPFAYDRGAPFRAGQRRGVDLAARPGQRVRSACAGRVTHAGPVPERGRGVTVRCGPLVATLSGLARTTVGRGQPVAAGAVVATAGPSGMVRLGARLAGDRWGWIDPLALVDGVRGPPALVPAPRAPRGPRAPGVRLVPEPPGTVAAHRLGQLGTGHLPVAPPRLPVVLWAGVVLLALGLGVHGGLWRSRRGRAARAAAGEALGVARSSGRAG